ncbi:MAG TPA: hypothetical protein VJ577_16045 [Burkholderiaceae bacterium]|nr:hypothetical protein [Burkholderiaceae bacterium]
MATFIKIGKRWRARVRKTEFPTLSETFDIKARAQEWTNRMEADMQARKFKDVRIIADKTMGDLINRYTEELTAKKPLGKNKDAVLKSLYRQFGHIKLPDLTVHEITTFVKNRLKNGAGGVTINIDLTYLKSVWKVANLPHPIGQLILLSTSRIKLAHNFCWQCCE